MRYLRISSLSKLFLRRRTSKFSLVCVFAAAHSLPLTYTSYVHAHAHKRHNARRESYVFSRVKANYTQTQSSEKRPLNVQRAACFCNFLRLSAKFEEVERYYT